MGGIAIVIATVIGYLFAHIRRESIAFATPGWALIALIVGLGFVGWIDDYLGVRGPAEHGPAQAGQDLRHRRDRGRRFAWLAVHFVHTDTHLSFTQPLDLDLGKVGHVLLDRAGRVRHRERGEPHRRPRRAGGRFVDVHVRGVHDHRVHRVPPSPASTGVLPAQALDQAVVAAAMFGACAGFLWWNAAPARIFMGDTGSLAIGGAMGGLALLTRTHLLLPLLAGLPAVETLSVIAQVISYRGFRKRVLRMAPIHHHFEVGGWSEFTVIVRFWLFAGICVALGVGIFYADFLRHGVNLG